MDEFDDKLPTSPLPSRLRVPRQQSTSSCGSTFSQSKPSRLANIRGTIRNTVRRKINPKARQDKMFLKRNEFLQYSTRHIKELEGAIEYFRKGFKSDLHNQGKNCFIIFFFQF